MRNRIADTLLNEEKRNKLFDWLRKHNVQIDPEFEEKLREYQKVKELEEWQSHQPQTTEEVEGYEEVVANTEESINNWLDEIAGQQEAPEGNWEFWIDSFGNIHKRGE